MRFIHTADWHLGHTLGGFSRDLEHARFLDWLLDRIDEENPDALFICGDVFEQGNPPAQALARYYNFLAEARRRQPRLSLVVIGGNHDAAPRIDAPGPILKTLGVHVTGSLPRDPVTNHVDPSRCIVPIVGKSGEVEALCAAVPFLRMADLPPLPADTLDPVVEGVRRTYGQIFEHATAAVAPGQSLLALGHCHMHSAVLSEDSERAVFGNAHALPVDIFPDSVVYAALGHLHASQEVGGKSSIRYSGSPIPLSMTERAYKHQVLVVDVEANRLVNVRPLFIPRTLTLLRIPEEAAPIDSVLDQLRALDLPSVPEEERPFLEVRVRLDAPVPDLRARVEQALEGKAVRLVRVQRDLAGSGGALADTIASSLAEIEPFVVLERLYERKYGGRVPDDVAAAFLELVDRARAGDRQ